MIVLMYVMMSRYDTRCARYVMIDIASNGTSLINCQVLCYILESFCICEEVSSCLVSSINKFQLNVNARVKVIYIPWLVFTNSRNKILAFQVDINNKSH